MKRKSSEPNVYRNRCTLGIENSMEWMDSREKFCPSQCPTSTISQKSIDFIKITECKLRNRMWSIMKENQEWEILVHKSPINKADTHVKRTHSRHTFVHGELTRRQSIPRHRVWEHSLSLSWPWLWYWRVSNADRIFDLISCNSHCVSILYTSTKDSSVSSIILTNFVK